MIYLITGTPGDGKSLRAVWYAERYLREGRPVFGNIAGYSRICAIPGMSPMVRLPNGLYEGGLGGDWRQTPKGSVVIYDEAHKDFPARGLTGVVPDRVLAMTDHRHTDHDIFLVTQHPSYIDHFIRRLVGRHDHVRRLGSMNRVALLSANSVMELPAGVDSSNSEKTFWPYPKSLFSVYESATHHSVRHRIPQPVIFVLVLLLALFLLGFYSWSHFKNRSFSDSAASASASDSVVSAASAASVPSSSEPNVAANRLLALRPVEVRPVLPLDEYIQKVRSSRTFMGCARSVHACRCWDSKGDPLLVSDQICVAIMENSVLPWSAKILARKEL